MPSPLTFAISRRHPVLAGLGGLFPKRMAEAGMEEISPASPPAHPSHR